MKSKAHRGSQPIGPSATQPPAPTTPLATAPLPGWSPTGGPAYPTTVYQPVPPAPQWKKGPSPATIVWGLALVLVGVTVLGVAAGLSIDPAVTLGVILGGAGIALIISAIVAAASRRR
jgi:hypothetical protein